MLARKSAIPLESRFYRLTGCYSHFAGNAWVYDQVPGGDDGENGLRSTLRLFEDGVPLLDAHQSHAAIATHGGGRYSHWRSQIIFSASDNSDPNTNGRNYTYDFQLDPETWERAWETRVAGLWKFHPRADYFLARGGTNIPPPVACNLGLTNKCNLRCEICGSQKTLDQTGIRRRHMPRATFKAVAETLFPFMVTVELNSQGDPLLYPDITEVLQRIRDFDCEIKVQTNGTLFTDRIVSQLLEQCGTVMLSLDAVGPKFDEVRQGGVWAKAEPGLRQFILSRDPRRLSVGVYPTLTKRTIGEAINVVRWGAEHDVDCVVFHRYVPIQNSWEEAPNDEEYAIFREQVIQWAMDNAGNMAIWFESERLSAREIPSRRTEFANPEKYAFSIDRSASMFPTESQNGDPLHICTSPLAYVEVGLEGQMGACCRAQDVTLGYATSVERFADAWFGTNYARIRNSLRRNYDGPYPLPNCEGCVKFFAPIAGGARTAINYDSEVKSSDALDFNCDTIEIEAIQKEHGHCHIAAIPPGVDRLAYALYENDRCLSALQSQHQAIRTLGGGRYCINARALYFSTSDGSDARRNGRQYSLRRMRQQEPEIRLENVVHDSGFGFAAELPRELDAKDLILLENDRNLGPADCLHDLIRREGSGRYSVWSKTLYFSASDNSDPSINGRYYRLKTVRSDVLAE
jgi:MoaA/NifB/PqqE/SkfB family radical SAM enzyme